MTRTLAMELYESLIEKRENTSEQKRAILETIENQTLLNLNWDCAKILN